MGLSESKIGQLPKEDVSEGSVPSTPILTPKNVKTVDLNELDPRSPTANICRTPIQLLLNESLEDSNLNETSTKQVVLGMDPRSPTAEFTRTPIVVNTNEDLIKKVHKRNIEKAKETPHETPSKPKYIAPKLLESSPVTSKPDANKRKSYVGLLETNVDFTETDLDTVHQLKNKIREPHTPIEKPSRVDIIKNESVDPRSPTADFIRTPLQIAKKIGEIDLNEDTEDLNKEYTEINFTEQFCEKSDEETETNLLVQNCEENNLVEAKDTSDAQNHTENEEEINLLLEDDAEKVVESPIKSTKHELDETETMTSQLENVTANVNDFDKKLCDLIYEDKDVLVVPRVVKLRENSRTPLGNRNSTGEIKKSIHKLKVSDKPRKSDGNVKKPAYTVSKIPVFREKGHKKKIAAVQCENTPPRNMEKKSIKTKKSHWDNDSTLVI